MAPSSATASGHRTYRRAPSSCITPDERPSTPTTPDETPRHKTYRPAPSGGITPNETLFRANTPDMTQAPVTKPDGSLPHFSAPAENPSRNRRQEGGRLTGSTTRESLSGNEAAAEFPFEHKTSDESLSRNTTPDENTLGITTTDEVSSDNFAPEKVPLSNKTPDETPPDEKTPDESPAPVTTPDEMRSAQQSIHLSSIMTVPSDNTPPVEQPPNNLLSENLSDHLGPVEGFNKATPDENPLDNSTGDRPPGFDSVVENFHNFPSHLNNRSKDEPPNYAAAVPTIYDPPCNCRECRRQWLPRDVQQRVAWRYNYTRAIPDKEARQVLGNLIRSIKDNWMYIETQCSRHGQMLAEHWTNKTSKQRASMLMAVDPKMYPHDPSLPHFYWEQRNSNQIESMKNYPNLHLLPYCNVEALAQDPAKFLGLLFNRIRYAPEQWVLHDDWAMKACWECALPELFFNEKTVMMHDEQYGKLIKRDPDSVHTWENIGFPKAQVILTAQRQLMGSLRKMVTKLIEGFPSFCTNLPNWEWKQEPGFKRLYELELPSTFLHQSFSEPLLLDFQKLWSLSKVRRDWNTDHLWLLQTDPSYMNYYIKRVGKAFGVLEIDDAEGFVDYDKMAEALLEDLVLFWYWEWVVAEVENLITAYNVPFNEIPRGLPLPQAIDDALGALDALVHHLINLVLRSIERQKGARPSFSYGWSKRDKGSDIYPGMPVEIRSDGVLGDDLFDKDPLDWVLTEMNWVPDLEKGYDGSIMFDYLERYLASNSTTREQKARLDEILYRRYADFGALQELHQMVRSHRPRSSPRTLRKVVEMESERGWKYLRRPFGESAVGWWKTGSRRQRLIELVATFDKLQQPSGNRDEVWLSRDKDSRAALDGIWKFVRRQFEKLHKELDFDPADVHLISASMSAVDCPSHIARIEEERAQILAELAARNAAKALKGKKSGKKLSESLKAIAETQGDPSSEPVLSSPQKEMSNNYQAVQIPAAPLFTDDPRDSDPENGSWEQVASKSKGKKSTDGKTKRGKRGKRGKRPGTATETQVASSSLDGSSLDTGLAPEIDNEVLAALPDDIRAEVIQQHREDQRRRQFALRNKKIDSEALQAIANGRIEDSLLPKSKVEMSAGTEKSRGRRSGRNIVQSLGSSAGIGPDPSFDADHEDNIDSKAEQVIHNTENKLSSRVEPVKPSYADAIKRAPGVEEKTNQMVPLVKRESNAHAVTKSSPKLDSTDTLVTPAMVKEYSNPGTNQSATPVMEKQDGGIPTKEQAMTEFAEHAADQIPTPDTKQPEKHVIEPHATGDALAKEPAIAKNYEGTYDQEQVQVQLYVEKFAFDVFRVMFQKDGKDPKAVTWTSFLQAMDHVGFVATHQCGSAVLFEPKANDEYPYCEWHGEGGILFDRPHPGPKIHQVILRAMGERMRKKYGWTQEMFLMYAD